MAVKVVLKKRFEAAMKEIRGGDRTMDLRLTADVRALIPEPPKALEIRGPSWSTIARGAAPPLLIGAAGESLPQTTHPVTPPLSAAGEGRTPLEVGAVVDYAGMKGIVEAIGEPPFVGYRVHFPNGARVLLTDRDLGRT